jgi:hypothetical protein
MSSQRRRRARRRQLAQLVPRPIFYSAVLAALVRRHWPAHLLGDFIELPCSVCDRRVLAHLPVLWQASDLAHRTGRDLAVLCLACDDDLRDSYQAAVRVELGVVDPALEARLRQWQALRN